ncbi:chorismate mutase [Enterococcus bulliens]
MKTEKEKMIAGELYFSADPELVADRTFAREQMRLINGETDPAIREQLIKETFGKVANHAYMEANVRFDYGYNIFLGKNFYANFDTVFLDVCPITFGDNCMIGPNVKLYTATHPLNPIKRNSGLEDGAPITVGDNAWIGGGATLLAGVTLGDNVVVGAGSVVTKSFPDNVVIAGNPAQIIREIGDHEEETVDSLPFQRAKIDEIDQKIARLLEERMDAVTTIVEIKKTQQTAVFDGTREESVLDNIRKSLVNLEYQKTIEQTFEDIMKRSREYQQAHMERDEQ